MKLIGFNNIDFSKHKLGYEIISKTKIVIFRKRRYRNRITGEWQYCSEITGKPYFAREVYILSKCCICNKNFFAPERLCYISNHNKNNKKKRKDSEKEIERGPRGGEYYIGDRVCSTKCKNLHSSKNKLNKYTFDNPTLNSTGYPSFYPNIDDPYAVRTKSGKAKMTTCHKYAMEVHLGRKLEKDELVHHIDMDKLNYNISNLYLTNEDDHGIIHGTYNKLCKELMNNYHKYSGIEFNKETGEYYLVN